MSEEEKKDVKKKSTISRREFLKDAGIVAGGIGTVAFLSACSPATSTVTTTMAGQTTTKTVTSTVTPAAVTSTIPGTTVTSTATATVQTVKLIVNGKPYELSVGYEVQPQHTLAITLRDTLGLTGTKVSCDYGACGRCVVLVDGIPTLSCLALTVECGGKNISTIEGLAVGGKLHPIQQAFVDYSALQCGFCTPAFIMVIKALLDKNPKPTEAQVKEAIAGILCRCSGPYPLMVEATLAASKGGQ